MTTDGHDRSSASRNPSRQPGRTPMAQRTLLVLMVLFGCLAVAALIDRMVLVGLAALALALAGGVLFLAGVQRPQTEQGAPETMKFWRGTSPKHSDGTRAAPPEALGQAADGHTGEDSDGEFGPDAIPLAAARLQTPDAGPDAAHPPGPGQPFGPASNAADKWDARPAPAVWDPPRVRSRPMPPSPPPTAPMPVSPDPAYRLPDPPVFAASSTAGQAPWHLPVGAAPSGLAADAARLGDLEVRAASVVGAGHRCQEPGPRQDAYALGRTPDGKFLVIAVADGVSQSPRSDLGARVAVSAATRELVAMLSSGGVTAIDMEHLYNAVAGEMLGTGRNRGLLDKDICSILILAVIPAVPRPDGMRQVWTSWIGDVSLWIHRQGSLYRVTGQEKSGMDRNTLNAVLPFNPDWAEQSTVNLQPSDRVAVVTDGLSDSLSGIPEAAEFFARQWAASAPHPAAFLHNLCYDGPGQSDDRTAVVVWCGPDQPAGPTGQAGSIRHAEGAAGAGRPL